MRPAPSLLLFTTLSGSGLGLLAWSGVGVLLGRTTALLPPLALGLALTAAGLLASLAHLGQPQRAWRALSQWRSSWLSREGVLALGLFPTGAGLGWALWTGSALAPWLAVALVVLAVATILCTAMIYACLKTVPAWSQPLVPAGFLGLGLMGGGLWLSAIGAFQGWRPGVGVLLVAGVVAVATLVAKLVYWRRLPGLALPAGVHAALGLHGRADLAGAVAAMDPPHTGASPVTAEMVFVFARRHAEALRLAAMLGLFALPAALAVPALASPTAAPWLLSAAALCFQAGALCERWLFFAEARHVVARYYPDRD
ncbi:MAG: dimethyl sulfoxide reductase anchor subunit family protein [Lysobacteraceae bacterium]